MRKSNIIIIAILIVASIVFLWLWNYLHFDLVDSPLDLIITIIWWAVIIIVCVAISITEKRRRETIRTAFLAPGLIFNSEAGIIRLKENMTFIDTLSNMLDGLDYTFEKTNIPKDSRTRFNYIVRSSKYARGGETWEGEFVRVSRPNNPLRFTNRGELAAYLEECQVA